MKKESSLNIKLSFGEEVGNAISHGVMFALLLLLLPVIALKGYLDEGIRLFIGNSIFIISLLLMFLSSTLYHSMQFDTKHKKIFRILDHIFIFVAIAGTYTPVALYAVDGMMTIVVLLVQWLCVIVGILYKAISKNTKTKVSLIIYLTMGWFSIILLPEIIRNTSFIFLLFIVLGGIMYSIGAWFYAQKTRPYFHFIWHLFINMASIFHIIAIVFFLV